jgi:hypothetical protein
MLKRTHNSEYTLGRRVADATLSLAASTPRPSTVEERTKTVAEALGISYEKAAEMIVKAIAETTPVEPELPAGRLVPRYRRDGSTYVVVLPAIEDIKAIYSTINNKSVLASFLKSREAKARRLLKKYGFIIKKQSASWNTECPVLYKVFFDGEDVCPEGMGMSLEVLELEAFKMAGVVESLLAAAKAAPEREVIYNDVMAGTDADDEAYEREQAELQAEAERYERADRGVRYYREQRLKSGRAA